MHSEDQVRERTGWSRGQLRSAIAEGRFPRAAGVTNGRPVWDEAAVAAVRKQPKPRTSERKDMAARSTRPKE